MNKFSYFKAITREEALDQINSTVSETIQPGAPPDSSVFIAGGIDLLDLMKEGLSRPVKLVSLKNIPGLNDIAFDEKNGLRIGANTTLAKIATDERIKANYFALHQAALQAATPQIRNMATLGGNLAQRTRCWYFRSKDHVCYRKGSSTCFAHIGENEYHAIMDYGYCVSVHASSLATALMAFNAAIEIASNNGAVKIVATKDFFVLPTVDRTRENILEHGELITAIILPEPKKNTSSRYIKMGERESNDWPVAEVAAVIELTGKKCETINIVLGAAAPVPVHSRAAEEAVKGNEINEETAKAAGIEVMKEAKPLSKNAYKIPIFETIIKRALEATLD